MKDLSVRILPALDGKNPKDIGLADEKSCAKRFASHTTTYIYDRQAFVSEVSPWHVRTTVHTVGNPYDLPRTLPYLGKRDMSKLCLVLQRLAS